MLIRQTLLYMPAQLLGPLFQFIAAVAWTHWLTADAYGVLTYILASQELVYVGCLSWWSQYTLRYAGAFVDEAARRRFQASETAIILAGLPLQAALTIALLAALHVPLTPTMLAAAILCCVPRVLASHLCERARGLGRIAVYTVGQSFGPVAGFLVALALVKFVEATPEAALFGFAAAQTIGVVWIWRNLRLGARVARPDPQIVKSALRFGTPLLLGGAIAWVSVNGIRLVVEHVQGAEAVGLVSVGWGLGQRLSSVVAMLVTAAAFPLAVKHLVNGSREGALRQLAMGGAILFALVAPAAAGVMLIARPMVELMIATPFQAMTTVILPLAALAGAVRNLRIHFSDQVFILFERTDLTLIINLVEAIGTVLFCAIGELRYGLPGAAAGCLLGSTIGAAFGFAFGVARFGLVIPWDHVARIAAATAVMSAVLMTPILANFAGPPLTRLVVEGAVGAAVYALALAALYPAAALDLMSRARALLPAAH